MTGCRRSGGENQRLLEVACSCRKSPRKFRCARTEKDDGIGANERASERAKRHWSRLHDPGSLFIERDVRCFYRRNFDTCARAAAVSCSQRVTEPTEAFLDMTITQRQHTRPVYAIRWFASDRAARRSRSLERITGGVGRRVLSPKVAADCFCLNASNVNWFEYLFGMVIRRSARPRRFVGLPDP